MLFITIINLNEYLPGGSVADGHGHVWWHDEEVSSELSLHTLNLRNPVAANSGSEKKLTRSGKKTTGFQIKTSLWSE